MAITYLGGGLVEGTNTQKTPSQIGSIFLHYDTSGVTGTNPVNQTGGAVLALTDFSGNGDDCSQSTASNKPTYDSDDQNGYPVVKFDGSNDSMSNSGEGQQSETSSSFTWVWVGKTPANSSGTEVMIRTTGSGSDYMKISGTGTNNNIEVETAFAYGATGAGFTESGYRDVWAVLIFSFDISTKKVTSYAGNSNEAVELKAVSTNDYYNSSNGVGAGTTTFLGLNGANNNQWGDIHLGEVIGFRKALSATEAEQLGAYLLYKWGITSTNPDNKETITNVPVGTRYHETDTRKIFRYGDAWVSTSGTLSGAVYLPAGSGDKTDGWTTTGTKSGGHRTELDKWNGTTWSDSGHDVNIQLNASTGNGSSSAITVAGSESGSGLDADGCSNYNGSAWTQKANTPENRGYTCSGGTSSALIWCGGAVGGVESNKANSFSLSGNSWTSEANMPTEAHMGAGDGTAVNTMFVAGGLDSNYTAQTTTQGYDGSSWSSSPAVLSLARSQCIGGGHKTAFWIMAGNPSALRGVAEYYNGTAWSSKPDTLLAISGSGGANNGATNPLVSGGKDSDGNTWTSGEYFGNSWIEKGSA